MKSNEERVREVMANVLETPFIDKNSSQDNIESWDSLKHLDIIVALEDEFDISIPVEEIGTMTSFKLIILIIEELLN